jgi:hypothetical protein
VDSILLTSNDGNNRAMSDNEKVAQAVFNGGGDDVRWRSSSVDFSGGGGVGRGSSSKRRIGTGSSDAAAQR